MRFSPEAQPLRELAVEKILEQNLVMAYQEQGLSLHEIEQLCDIFLDKRLAVFGRKTIEKALQRLRRKGRVKVAKPQKNQPDRYRLSDDALAECRSIEEAAAIRNKRILTKLFGGSDIDPSLYSEAFFQCIHILFSRLGEAYVRLLKGDISPGQLVSMPDVRSAIAAALAKHRVPERSLFERAITKFLLEPDPDFDLLKWNMSQNYFVAKTVGLNASDLLLSRELFSNATLYLDTNVVINAVEPKARHHHSLGAFIEACRALNIKLLVCRVSYQELQRVVDSRRKAIKKIATKIPEDLKGRIQDVFYRLYLDAASKSEEVDPIALFANFDNAKAFLSDNYDIEEIDDLWFDSHAELGSTLELANLIRTEYKHKRARPKTKGSALHDALVLDWMRLKRDSDSPKTWLVTLDNSLPDEAVVVKKDHSKSCVLTLDALLQWISPIAISEATSDQVAAVFSEAIRNRLLPQDNLFTLNDFLIFAGIEWDIRELPSKDVEECIRYIRNNAPDLDPDDPIDREKISHELARFFVDPARKYKEDIANLRSELEKQQKSENEKVAAMESQLREKSQRLEQFELQMQEIEKSSQQQSLVATAKIRLGISALPSVAVEVVSVILASTYGVGDNLLQKILSFWPYLTAGVLAFPFAAWIVVGKERLKALGWPFGKMAD
jgi:predicted nucleic acid-binding protein/DNA-binding transcriptional MerR regulator